MTAIEFSESITETQEHILNVRRGVTQAGSLSGFIYSQRSAPARRLCHSGLVVPSHDRNDDKILHHGKLTSPRYSHLLGDVIWRRPSVAAAAGVIAICWMDLATQKALRHRGETGSV